MLKEEIAKALEIADVRERYVHVYDLICDCLDKKFKENNYCDFQDDKCIVNRSGLGKNKNMGCCYSFRLDFFANMRDKKICKYLGDKGCMTKCIPCKLYVCKYLERKGIGFSVYSFKGIEKVWSAKQLEVLKSNCFKSKEEIIDKLLEVREGRMPYLLFSLLNKAKIR